MSNLFKKGFASLALASAMASSAFAGDAAYIDVKVNYLSGTGKAVLGYESWNAETSKYKVGARKDLVELYIRVLDKDGNLADKDSVSDVLIPMILTRSGSTKNVNNLRTDTSDGNVTGEADAATHSIVRSVVVNKNSARYTLDYTMQNSATTVDKLIIKAGNLKKSFDIQLTTIDATSLIVRATTKTSIDFTFGGKGKYLNDNFTNIKLLGDSSLVNIAATSASDGNLSGQSHSVPQIIAGETIPLRIYASTALNNDLASDPASGRFTLAPNLEGKKIVVVAVGDYGASGSASVYLGQTELTMQGGIAAGDMTINHGLAERNNTALDAVSGSVNFDLSNQFGGLGVAFIVYAKDYSNINNHAPVSLSNGALKISSLGIEGNASSTDAIKVKSGPAAAFKGGKFTHAPKNGKASGLWTGNKTDVFVANSRGILPNEENRTISITVVDKLGNPAILATSIVTGDALPVVLKVSGNKQGTETIDDKFDFNITDKVKMVTNLTNGVTSAVLLIRDGYKEVALSSDVEATYSGESVAGLAPFKFNVHTIDLSGNTPSDIVGDLRNYVTDINVSNNSGSKTIYSEKATKDEYANMKVYVRVVGVDQTRDGNRSVKLLFKAINNKGDIDTGIFFRLPTTAGGPSSKTDGGAKFDINATAAIQYTAVEIASSTSANTGVISTIQFKDVNNSDNSKNLYKGIIGTTTTFILKANGVGENNNTYRRSVDAYVATTTTSDNAKDFVDSSSKPGKAGKTVIDFDFSGTLVDQYAGKTVATITFISGNYPGNNDSLKAGVVGQPFVPVDTIEASANTRVVKAMIPKSKRLSVALYGTYGMHSDNKDTSLINSDANKTSYNIQSITMNGFTGKLDGNTSIVYISRHGNKLTDAVDINVLEDKNITVAVGDESLAGKVKINGLGGTTTGDASGKNTKNMNALPSGLVAATSYGTKAIKTKKLVPVSTNTYYTLFDKAENLEVQDAYGNQADMGEIKLEKNYVLSVSDTECAEVAMSKGFDPAKPANIYFKPCAAGKEIDLIVSVSGNEEVKNTITFTNIVKKTENTKFIVSLNVGDTDYNIVNNDVVIKVIGDGGTERAETKITVVSDNKEAIVKAVPVDLIIGREFGDLTGSGTSFIRPINAQGSYFVITADKPGKITVTADGVIPSSESVSGDDVAITGTTSFTMVNVDTSAPTVTATSTSSSITVTVKDDGLDAIATTVKINDMSGKEVAVAKHTSGGVYVASDLKQGTYSVDVYAMDLSGNIHKQIIVQNVGAGSGSMTVEEEATAMLLATKEYEVTGTFTKHNFGDNSAKNWVYTQKSDGKSYQLLGDAPSEKDVFGWKETDVKVGAATWYMIRTGTGRFDWVLSNTSGVTYKLKGAKDNGSFDFSGRLNLNASYKDGMLTFTKSK